MSEYDKMSAREIFQRFISAHIYKIADQIQNGFIHRQVYVETKKKMYYTAKRIKVVDSRVAESKILNGWLKPDGCIFKCKKNGTYFYSLGHRHYTLPELKYLNFDFNFKDKDRFIYEVNGKYYQADCSNGYVDYVYELTETIDDNTADNDLKLIGHLWDSAVTFMAILANVSKNKGTQSALMDMTETMKSILGIPSNPLRFLVSLGHQYFKYILDAFGIVGSNNKKEVSGSTGYSDLVEKIVTDYLTKNLIDENDSKLGNLFSKILYKNKEMRNLEAHFQPCYSAEREPSLTYFIYDSIILIYFIKHVKRKDNQSANQEKLKHNVKPEIEKLYKEFYIPVSATQKIDLEGQKRYGDPARFLLCPYKDYEVKYESQSYIVRILDISHLDYEIQQKNDNDFSIVPVNDFKVIKKSADYFQRMIAVGNEMRSLLEKNLSTDDLREQFIGLLQKQFDRQDDRETLGKMIAAINTEKNADFELLVERFRVEVIPYLEGMQRSITHLEVEVDELKQDQKEIKEGQDNIVQEQEELKTGQANLEAGQAGIAVRQTALGEKVDEFVKKIKKKFKKIHRWILGSAIAAGIIAIVLTVLGFMAFDSDIYTKNGTAYRLAYAIHGNGDMAYARAMYLEDKIIKHDSVADQPYFQSINDSSITYNKYVEMRYEAAQRYRDAIRDYTLSVEKDSEHNPEAAARLARMYLFGKGGTIDPDKALRYAGIANRYGKNNQGLYIYTYYINNDYSDTIPYMADLAAEQTLDDPYLPLIQQICEIEKEGREDSPDRRKLQSLIEGLKDSTFNNTDVHHAALLYILDKQTNGMTDKNGNTIYSKDLYKAAETADYLASRMNSLYGELWLGTTMQNLGVATYYDHFVAAAYNGNSSGLYFVRQMAENKEQFEDAQPLLAEEFGRNNDLAKVKKLMEYLEERNWKSALICLNDLKKGFSDKTIGSTLDIPRTETLIRLNIPDSAKTLRERLQTAPLLERNFLTGASDDTRRRAALAYADALFYANGYGGMEQDGAKEDSLLKYAASLGMEDAAYALGQQRLINRHERKSAEKLLAPFFDSSDRMRRLASQFYKLGDPARSQSYLKQIKNPRDIYKTVAEMYVYLEGEGRNREKDSLMYNRIMESWDINDGNTAYLNGSILALLDDLSGNNKKRQEFYRTLWFSHSAAACQLSNNIHFPDSLSKILNDYYAASGDRATLRAFFALCNSKDKESAFNRASQIIQLNNYLPAALTWLNSSAINKVTNKELENVNYLLPKTPGFYVNANWHELPAPDEAYTDLNSIFQLN